MNRVAIYDTTLRDGMQGIDVNYTLEDKLQIAHELDAMRIDYIEGGFPQSNAKEMAFFEQCRKQRFAHAKICAFGSTRKANIRAEEDSNLRAVLQAETPVVTIVGKTWIAHVREVLRTTPEENLAMIADSIRFLKREGREVIYDCEHFFDGYQDNPDYALRILETASEAGADVVVPCDTNGGTLPETVARIYAALPKERLAPLGGHFHDDCGTATANSLAAIDAGAIQIQGTINGWGERCGNANLCILIPNICIKKGLKPAVADRLSGLTKLSRFVAEKANIIPNKRQPYVGEAAFSHKAGQHADVVVKSAALMEHIDGALVGNERRVLLSELAGKSTIVHKLSRYGDYDKNSSEVAGLIATLKRLESDGYEFEAAEASFELLMLKAIGRYRPLIRLRNYHLETYKSVHHNSSTVGRLFLETDSAEMMGAGVGVGPVETLDAAIRHALRESAPFLQQINLVDYRVRVLNPEESTAAKVRVFITSSDHNHSWDTVGVHENIIEASWQALVDSFEYYYNVLLSEEAAAAHDAPPHDVTAVAS